MFHEKGPTFAELVRQALSSTKEGYQQLAPKFDYTPFCTPAALLEHVADRLRDGPEIDAAIDLCCGTGEVLRFLQPITRRRLVGVDFSPAMLAEADGKLRATERPPGHDPKVQLLASDVFWIPKLESFDLVTCFGAFGHIEEDQEERFIKVIHGLLRPGGRFVFVTTRMPPVLSRAYLLSRGFNATMRVRNALIKPAFVMYYLTFLLPDVKAKLENAGFDVAVEENCFEAPFESAILVTATRR